MGVPPIAVAAMAIIIKVAVTVVVAMVMAVIMAAAAVVAPGKGSGKNPEKSSPRKKKIFPSGLLTRNETYVGVINTPINISPA